MSTNHTTNYDLNQWEGTDKVLRTEFNQDNAKIDAALKANADAIAAEAAARASADTALEASLVGKGNCQIETFAYTGTGTAGAGNPTRLNFNRPPVAVILYSSYNQVTLISGQTYYPIITRPVNNSAQTSMIDITVTWSGNQVSFYHYDTPRYQFNEKDRDYWGFALFAMDENE